MPTPEIDEFTRLNRQLNLQVANALSGLDDEIKETCNKDPEVAEKIEDVYSAITDLQAAIEEYGKRENETMKPETKLNSD